MKLRLERRWKKATYVIGVLFIDGIRYCETLEDRDRGLKASDTLAYIQAHKVPGETAIPAGIYVVDMRTVSPKYSAVKFYQDVCGGRVPRLVNVPGFSGSIQLIYKGMAVGIQAVMAQKTVEIGHGSLGIGGFDGSSKEIGAGHFVERACRFSHSCLPVRVKIEENVRPLETDVKHPAEPLDALPGVGRHGFENLLAESVMGIVCGHEITSI